MLLQKQVKEEGKSITDILSLADELKMGTIEKAIKKSDLKQGIEFIKKFFK